jgi:excisionase family DNA binding protein
MDKLLLKPAEAAEALGVGRSTIYLLLASGEVPSMRVGRSIRVPVEALRRWVAARTGDTDSGRSPSGDEFR